MVVPNEVLKRAETDNGVTPSLLHCRASVDRNGRTHVLIAGPDADSSRNVSIIMTAVGCSYLSVKFYLQSLMLKDGLLIHSILSLCNRVPQGAVNI